DRNAWARGGAANATDASRPLRRGTTVPAARGWIGFRSKKALSATHGRAAARRATLLSHCCCDDA
ncbi:hypothetical protein, partial [Xanthomonas sp. WHRI 7945]|nr:hypothetical protein [Xanthomonas campestris pv. campestris]